LEITGKSKEVRSETTANIRRANEPARNPSSSEVTSEFSNPATQDVLILEETERRTEEANQERRF